MPIAVLLLAAAPVQTIRYETGACFGFCPAYVVTVSSDGRGVFVPRGATATKRTRRFAVTPAQFAAFARALKPVRPNGEVLIEPGRPLCRVAATDQVTVDVRWMGGQGDPRHLSFYQGCDMGTHRDLEKAVARAPAALPIAGLIGRR